MPRGRRVLGDHMGLVARDKVLTKGLLDRPTGRACTRRALWASCRGCGGPRAGREDVLGFRLGRVSLSSEVDIGRAPSLHLGEGGPRENRAPRVRGQLADQAVDGLSRRIGMSFGCSASTAEVRTCTGPSRRRPVVGLPGPDESGHQEGLPLVSLAPIRQASLTDVFVPSG